MELIIERLRVPGLDCIIVEIRIRKRQSRIDYKMILIWPRFPSGVDIIRRLKVQD